LIGTKKLCAINEILIPISLLSTYSRNQIKKIAVGKKFADGEICADGEKFLPMGI